MPSHKTIVFVVQSIMAGMSMALVLLLFNPDWLQRPDSGLSHSYRKAVAKSAPAVVNVYASKYFQQRPHPLFQDPIFKRFFGEVPTVPNQRRDSNLGSGVIIRPDGYILTSAHLVSAADEINITLADGRHGNAILVGTDTATDLAVLKTEIEELPSMPVGDPARLQTGDVVLAIGNPYDFGQTVTQGIISAMGRSRLGITTIENFIQTDADINPGNSGGALVNVQGEMIGINSAIISSTGGSQGIGLAVPVNIALRVMDQIIRLGRVDRGWLGIEAQRLSPDVIRNANLDQGGVLIAGVLENGPAFQAGIRPGDIILSIQDQAISDPQQAIRMISEIRPGTRVRARILRGWDEVVVEMTVDRRPEFQK
ncbi:MAG: trypsin-like peptidase domain-containing protein [Thiotrichales bacterium]|nr:trypsin-like peptidase domain-containing protein [Thiotrichales bacterium]